MGEAGEVLTGKGVNRSGEEVTWRGNEGFLVRNRVGKVWTVDRVWESDMEGMGLG